MVFFKQKIGLLIVIILFAGCQSSNINDNNDKEYVNNNIQVSKSTKEIKTPAQWNAELGAGYLQQGQLERAMVKLRKSLRQNPKLGDAHHYMAELYRRLGEKKSADRHYRLALKYSSYSSPLHNNYGIFLCQNEQYDASVEQFLLAIKNPLYKHIAKTYENAGLCMLKKPDMLRAKEYFLLALQHNANQKRSLLEMLKIFYQNKQYELAKTYLERFEKVAYHTSESVWIAIQLADYFDQSEKLSSYKLLLQNKFPKSKEYTLWRQYKAQQEKLRQEQLQQLLQAKQEKKTVPVTKESNTLIEVEKSDYHFQPVLSVTPANSLE